MNFEKRFWTLTVFCVLIFLSGIFDVWSTVRLQHFRLLEANPIFLFFSNFWVVVVMKFFVLALMCVTLFYLGSKRMAVRHTKLSFFFFYACVLMIVAQMAAGTMNLILTEKIMLASGVDSVSEITQEAVVNYNIYDLVSKYVLYYRFVFFVILYPLLIGFFTFCLWLWSIAPEYCLLCRLTNEKDINTVKTINRNVNKIDTVPIEEKYKVEIVDL